MKANSPDAFNGGGLSWLLVLAHGIAWVCSILVILHENRVLGEEKGAILVPGGVLPPRYGISEGPVAL